MLLLHWLPALTILLIALVLHTKRPRFSAFLAMGSVFSFLLGHLFPQRLLGPELFNFDRMALPTVHLLIHTLFLPLATLVATGLAALAVAVRGDRPAHPS